MRKLFLTGLVLIFGLVMAAQETSLPFKVKVGGQEAQDGKTFATVAEPIASNAELEVDSKEAMIIVNVFPSDDKGKTSGAAKIIMLQNTNKTNLDKTMDKSKLKPGTYLMNIVAGGATARVLFKVK